MVYIQFTGGTMQDAMYKLGRIFGNEIYENNYQQYKSRRDRYKTNDSYRKRYDREN